ncbi:SDR family NAD(P)-dependent oxidoreductase [Solimonas terrae]|uniref:SDR family NAD(P)-dependent oxidoreductase n=1 Tax=Solimonas terrae TaxID=1396819 RepID=A0A6M2BMQ3_9GAMM|nr:SDR family NAD(P)-dependent oxidoreductase [Solimonas terrae]NGY03369.1 SDR family NAD(P)-dependent oxidoreductase [Solimonas terrae]
MSFADRYGPWAVIAGASEGTGRAFALQIASLGVGCILLARRQAPLAALADEIRAESGVDCVTACVDLAAPDAFAQIKAAVGAREVGLFVSNAGADPHGSRFLDRDVGDWLALAQRNTLITLQCCHHFAAPMTARGRGGLLLVNSGACYGGSSFMATYAASKAFTLCFGEGLWAELQPQGVDVLNLILGRTDTPAFRQLLADKGQPLPDNIASVDEVARVGLERLAHGPVHNWGVTDDSAGFAPSSAAARRERTLMIDRYSKQIFGEPS